MVEDILLARDALRWRNQPPDQCGFYIARVSRGDAAELRLELDQRRSVSCADPRSWRMPIAEEEILVAIVQDVAVLTKRRAAR